MKSSCYLPFLRPGTELRTGDFPVWAANNSRLLVEGEVRLSARIGERAFFIDFLVTPRFPSPSSARGVCRSLGSCGIMLAARWSFLRCVTSLWTSAWRVTVRNLCSSRREVRSTSLPDWYTDVLQWRLKGLGPPG